MTVLLLLLLAVAAPSHARLDTTSRRLVTSWNITRHSSPTPTAAPAAINPTRFQQQNKANHFSFFGWSFLGPFLSVSVGLFLMKRKCNTESKGEESAFSPPDEVELNMRDSEDDMYIHMDDDVSIVTISSIGLKSAFAAMHW